MEIPKKLQQKLDEGRQYRSVVEIRALGEADGGEKIVEGYACTFNQPYELYSFEGYTVREQIDRGAFGKCDMSDCIMQFDHAGTVYARTSNKTLSLATDDHGLKIRADLGGTEAGRQLYEEIKGGYVTKMSFGFVVDTDTREVHEDHTDGNVDVLRTITGIRKLYDVSAVSLPANNATEISARSYCDGVIAELTEERRKAEERERMKQKIKIMLNL